VPPLLRALVAVVAAMGLLAGCAHNQMPAYAPAAAVANGAPNVRVGSLPPVTIPKAASAKTGKMTSGWALLDRATGQTRGSDNASTFHNTTESMIKAWIAADYLRTLDKNGQTPGDTVLDEITLMIIDSNDVMAEKYYQLGGRNTVVERLQKICGLTDTHIYPYYWALTDMTVADALRYATCLADGRAAGPKWTGWLLDVMTKVRGGVTDNPGTETKQGGRWGIIDALPADVAAQTSIKNGWTFHGHSDNVWHVNCMAINPKFVLVVETIAAPNLQTAADFCADTAKIQLAPLL
jgi:hypothetical protein